MRPAVANAERDHRVARRAPLEARFCTSSFLDGIEKPSTRKIRDVGFKLDFAFYPHFRLWPVCDRRVRRS